MLEDFKLSNPWSKERRAQFIKDLGIKIKEDGKMSISLDLEKYIKNSEFMTFLIQYLAVVMDLDFFYLFSSCLLRTVQAKILALSEEERELLYEHAFRLFLRTEKFSKQLLKYSKKHDQMRLDDSKRELIAILKLLLEDDLQRGYRWTQLPVQLKEALDGDVYQDVAFSFITFALKEVEYDPLLVVLSDSAQCKGFLIKSSRLCTQKSKILQLLTDNLNVLMQVKYQRILEGICLFTDAFLQKTMEQFVSNTLRMPHPMYVAIFGLHGKLMVIKSQNTLDWYHRKYAESVFKSVLEIFWLARFNNVNIFDLEEAFGRYFVASIPRVPSWYYTSEQLNHIVRRYFLPHIAWDRSLQEVFDLAPQDFLLWSGCGLDLEKLDKRVRLHLECKRNLMVLARKSTEFRTILLHFVSNSNLKERDLKEDILYAYLSVIGSSLSLLSPELMRDLVREVPETLLKPARKKKCPEWLRFRIALCFARIAKAYSEMPNDTMKDAFNTFSMYLGELTTPVAKLCYVYAIRTALESSLVREMVGPKFAEKITPVLLELYICEYKVLEVVKFLFSECNPTANTIEIAFASIEGELFKWQGKREYSVRGHRILEFSRLVLQCCPEVTASVAKSVVEIVRVSILSFPEDSLKLAIDFLERDGRDSGYESRVDLFQAFLNVFDDVYPRFPEIFAFAMIILMKKNDQVSITQQDLIAVIRSCQRSLNRERENSIETLPMLAYSMAGLDSAEGILLTEISETVRQLMSRQECMTQGQKANLQMVLNQLHRLNNALPVSDANVIVDSRIYNHIGFGGEEVAFVNLEIESIHSESDEDEVVSEEEMIEAPPCA